MGFALPEQAIGEGGRSVGCDMVPLRTVYRWWLFNRRCGFILLCLYARGLVLLIFIAGAAAATTPTSTW
jgi:hypothetical protein